jgi:hypothetical protein
LIAEVNMTYIKTFKFHDDQVKTIDAAIEKAKAVEGILSDEQEAQPLTGCAKGRHSALGEGQSGDTTGRRKDLARFGGLRLGRGRNRPDRARRRP